MRQRLPLILSATALVVAVLGSTPVGNAVMRVVPLATHAGTAGFATNAGAVNNIKASRHPRDGWLVALGPDGKFPASVGQAGPQGPAGPTGPTGPQGPAGAAGAAGAKGPAGLQGASGLSGLEVDRTNDTMGASSIYDTVVANCPAGKMAIAGSGLSFNTRLSVMQSAPTSTDLGWQVEFAGVNAETAGADSTVVAYVICAHVATS